MQLNLGNLKKIREALTNLINAVRTEAFAARNREEISQQQLEEIVDNKLGNLETLELQLQAHISMLEQDFILRADFDSPRSRILNATAKLKSAASAVDKFSEVLSAISKVISIFSNIVNAISGGGILTFPDDAAASGL